MSYKTNENELMFEIISNIFEVFNDRMLSILYHCKTNMFQHISRKFHTYETQYYTNFVILFYYTRVGTTFITILHVD